MRHRNAVYVSKLSYNWSQLRICPSLYKDITWTNVDVLFIKSYNILPIKIPRERLKIAVIENIWYCPFKIPIESDRGRCFRNREHLPAKQLSTVCMINTGKLFHVSSDIDFITMSNYLIAKIWIYSFCSSSVYTRWVISGIETLRKMNWPNKPI